MPKGQADRFRHVAPASERAESIETQIGVPEAPAEDLAQVHDAGNGTVLTPAGQQASKVSFTVTVHVRLEGGFIGGWMDPWVVQVSAGARKPEKLVSIFGTRRTKIDALAHLARCLHGESSLASADNAAVVVMMPLG
jgi:hypothetical protein